MRELKPDEIVRLESDAVVVLDQRWLPDREVELRCASAAELAEAIRVLAVRGAPAIGVAAAYGMALAAGRGEDLDAAFDVLATSRPTAVNLRWALTEMRDDPSRERAERIHLDEVARCKAMGAHAVELFPKEARVLTHCNAGGLATGGYGTALGAIRSAWEAGRVAHVWVDETRPLLQGARLTAWELEQLGIPHTVIADVAAASFIGRGEVDLIVTGADRIAANGDTANKIGTYGLAVLARAPRRAAGGRRADVDPRPVARERRGDPDRGARPGRGDGAVRGEESRLRRHAVRPRGRDRHRARRPPGAVRRDVAARGRRGTMILDELDPRPAWSSIASASTPSGSSGCAAGSRRASSRAPRTSSPVG